MNDFGGYVSCPMRQGYVIANENIWFVVSPKGNEAAFANQNLADEYRDFKNSQRVNICEDKKNG